MAKNFDVTILGGGLAGLTLSIQLKQNNPDISIQILEMRPDKAPDSAHKVGESTVELGTHYIREVLNLKDYLDEHQLPKHGLRFFFTPEHKTDISKRVELGPRERLPVPSHQLDRGTFENKLSEIATELGVDIQLGAKVVSIDINEETHTVGYTFDNNDHSINTRWIVDATGRSSFLKRKLGFKKDLDHPVSSAWFRLKGEIDVDHWSNDQEWSSFLKPGLRRLGTIHFMDKGYWVWLIPLATGNTSVGIVADPNHHPFEEYNTYEKAMLWLKKNEPLCYEHLDKKRDDLLDFRVLKHFAHHSEKAYSTERWAVSGESGLFLDPFYSPGTDFIAISNTFVTDLICRELDGEDVFLRTNIYEQTYFSLFDNWVPIYQDKYKLWGLTQTMVLKIFWDWAVYWSVPTLLFTNHGFTNISVLRELFSSETAAGQKFGILNGQMQRIFVEWSDHDTEVFTNRYIDPFDIEFLKDFHKGIDEQHSPEELIEKIKENVELLEAIAVEIYLRMSNKIHGSSLSLKINPYEMSLLKHPQEEEAGIQSSQEISKDVGVMWFYN